MFTPPAAEHACAVKHMHSADGRNRGGDPTSWNPGGKSFSEKCGRTFAEEEKSRRLNLSQSHHPVEVIVEDGESETVVFEGKLVGDQLIPLGDGVEIMGKDGILMIPETITSGMVVVRFGDYSRVRTPTASGIGHPVEGFRHGCHVKRFTAIER
ncbi:MAG TPA: hypothetical protein VFV22_00150 [Candidatus Paceibacterota bacterium]|nr:hypothetical protein [Candidatus Paceibacterota bacterium]